MEIYLDQPYSFYQLGRRGNQEDARFPDEDIPQDYKPAFIVCDGVGGEDHGEIASHIVADTIGRCMQDFDLSKPFGLTQFKEVLVKAQDNLDQAAKKFGYNMATTLTFLCFHSEGVFLSYIGDSRIYHVRPKYGILFRSEDHSLVNALVHSGNITPQEAINHPQGNIITRCLKPSKNGEIEEVTTLQVKDIEPGDYFFLCSDGVLHHIDDKKLTSILTSDKSDKQKIDEIAKLASSSSDNNTAFLIRIAEILDQENNYSIPVVESIQTQPITDSLESTKTDTVIQRQKKQTNLIKEFFKKIF